jgi:ribosome-binding factor A
MVSPIQLAALTLRHSLQVRVHMPLDKKTREQLRTYCGQLQEDDGVDPRQFFRLQQDREKRNRKALQLCKQAAVTLELALSGEFGDEYLQNLEVVSVEPAPNTSQLAVTLRMLDATFDLDETSRRLEAVAGRLRAAIASAITRKRTPKLMFRVVKLQG